MTEAGAVVELEVGPPGNGGFCVARHDGRVVFVRHALPGERVRAAVTEDAGRYLRADAVEVLRRAPERVEPPCPHAGPGRCGGCDWQHASGTAQRRIKAEVVREQFRRLAGIDVDLEAAEELPGGLLGWRTRIAYALAPDGSPGLRRHRSHEVERLRHCPLGVSAVSAAPDPSAVPARCTAVELVTGDNGTATVAHRPAGGTRRRGPARGRRPPDRTEIVAGPARIRHHLLGRDLEVSADGFWQVHPAALPTFAAAVIGALQPAAGERVLDLYAGAGPLTAVLADAVGPGGQVVGIESSPAAVSDAADNLAATPWATVVAGRVDARRLADAPLVPDLVVLDPPRAGLGAEVMRAVLELAPRLVGYLSCDPATLARDVRVALDAGWRLVSLRAFDAFPMTHHVECLAVLSPPHP